MIIYKNNIARVIAGIFTMILVLKGKHHITTFFQAILEPGRGRYESHEVLIGGLLFTILLMAVIGFFRIFFEKN